MRYDESGNVTEGTAPDGSTTSYTYDPVGNMLTKTVGGIKTQYSYNAATGTVYLRARFYEPAMNRFSQKDIVRGSITAPNSLNRYTYVQNDPINFIDPSGQSLKSAWNMVKSSVTNTVKNIVSNPVQAVKSAAKAVVNAVTHPIKTATNAAKSAGNAVRTIYNEVRTPDSQSKYASPATNRGTGSASAGGSYNGSSGGGAYTAPVYSPYNSNGNATSYFNSSYQSGKAPSSDSPRIEDVDGGTTKICENGDREKTDWAKHVIQNSSWTVDSDVEFALFVLASGALTIASVAIPIAAIGLAIAAAPETLGGSLVVAGVVLSALAEGGVSFSANTVTLIQGIGIYKTNGSLEVSLSEMEDIGDVISTIVLGPITLE